MNIKAEVDDQMLLCQRVQEQLIVSINLIFFYMKQFMTSLKDIIM